MQETYDAEIAPGIRDAGYAPFRVDDPPTNKGISDTILAQIRAAEFVVADFTGQRQSVYFEAGFARGLGREVIWCCRDDELKNLHFDIKHLPGMSFGQPPRISGKNSPIVSVLTSFAPLEEASRQISGYTSPPSFGGGL